MSRLFASAGLLGGLLWIGLAFFPPVGLNATRANEIAWNRLWTPALLGLLLGFVGLFRIWLPVRPRLLAAASVALQAGLALMLLGSFTEYWLLSRLPHTGPGSAARSLAWMSVLLGWLIALLAATVVGLSAYRSRALPRPLSLLLMSLVPLTLAIAFISINWAGTPLGLAGLAAGLAAMQLRRIPASAPAVGVTP
jgi:hypothetical protein